MREEDEAGLRVTGNITCIAWETCNIDRAAYPLFREL